MTGLDANLLLYAYAKASPEHVSARSFLESLAENEAVAVSEFTLTEFYLLLRNPAVLKHPLAAEEAVEVIEAYRNHPCWRIPGFPPFSRPIHDRLWSLARQSGFARRRIYDVRTALTLQAAGVDEFATANVKDFQGLGFKRVWNPLVEGPGRE
jgi:predicted nucleic acid-binding protein